MTATIIPEHIAIILDGNRRWAKENGLSKISGHKKGSKTVEEICECCKDLGVRYLTLYAFSTENWARPKEEVDALMKLLKSYLKQCIKNSIKNNIVIKIIGNRERLDKSIIELIENAEESTKNCSGLNLNIAINYGSRDEIIRVIKNISSKIKSNDLDIDSIDEKCVDSYLDTSGIPDPDLLIRTSGEKRLSNFLLWQIAYTEFYFTDVYWPDFNKEELLKAIDEYNTRNRRFGKN